MRNREHLPEGRREMNWRIINSGPCDAAFNMALDEALLESVSRLGSPVLRFYGWTQPAATFGYFQHFAEIESTTPLRPLIRRPTGGGLVPHDADWTYSLAFPAGHEWHSLRAEESYRRVHEWIHRAFTHLGVETELAPCCKKTAPGQCFVGYEKSDLLWHGKKIAGAAQRRNKLGLLIQGSVQPPPIHKPTHPQPLRGGEQNNGRANPVPLLGGVRGGFVEATRGLSQTKETLSSSRSAWEEAMLKTASNEANWSELTVAGGLLELTQSLVAQKYSRPDYNQKR